MTADELHITSQGTQRTYRRFVPSGYDPATPTPLVLNLHGISTPITAQVIISDFEAKAEEVGAIVLTPLGSGPGPSWNVTERPDLPDEASFLDDLIDHTESEACIDARRIYAIGMSNGAQMSSLLGCALSGQIAAIAPVGGFLAVAGCKPDRPVPVISFHGTADEYLAFTGGTGPKADSLPAGPVAEVKAKLDLLPIPEVEARWAQIDGCTGSVAVTKVTTHVSLRRYATCRAGAEVELYVVAGGGHSWPGSKGSASIANAVGPTTMEIDANDLIWDFFERHPLPA